jgi:CRP-like cAMP-binding protein
MIPTRLLIESPLFTALPEDTLAPFAALAEAIHCPAGKTLFREGEEATRLYLLMSGKIAVQVQPIALTQPLTLVSLSTFGQLVGWSGFVPPNYYTASAICQEDSDLLAFEGEAFNRLLNQDPAPGLVIMGRIAAVISQRLRILQGIVIKTMYYEDEQ